MTIDKGTVLHYMARLNFSKTAENRFFKVLRKLIKAGADPNAKNAHGETPLHFAALHDKCEAIVNFLLTESGVDINIINEYVYFLFLFYFILFYSFLSIQAVGKPAYTLPHARDIGR